jgi:hypothetical protein
MNQTTCMRKDFLLRENMHKYANANMILKLSYKASQFLPVSPKFPLFSNSVAPPLTYIYCEYPMFMCITTYSWGYREDRGIFFTLT